ncbi:MAG: primosomal protein N', partial [candidate division Zixibacteria bacterium]
ERALGITPMVWHSRLTPAEKANVFKRSRSGDVKLLIGARSSIFCPLKKLGLIVVDEEQDGSYKQDDPAPRYNARDLALERGRISGSTVILGSATPSVETYHSAAEGKIELFTLPQRVTGKGLPEIRVISTSLKEGAKTGSVFPIGFWPVSEPLYTELSIRLKKKEQAIILLNKRGYSSSVVCFECGWVGRCPDCEIGWTYHKSRGKMVCHYCGIERSGPSGCPDCGSSKISFKGAGTEKLEETLKSLFPSVRINRLDSDVATAKWKSRDILDDFGKKKIDILLGTQMVAKGHHFPAVGFVGVVGADVGLSLPDFRASERVLQLLTQASGRAGRSSKKSERGLVMIQTFSPQNMIFEHLLKDDYTGFLERELELRKALAYPPYTRLISILISSVDSSKAANGAKHLKEEIERRFDGRLTEILGPAKASIFKRGKEYRFQILLKIPIVFEHGEIAARINYAARDMRTVSVRIDIDPFSFV